MNAYQGVGLCFLRLFGEPEFHGALVLIGCVNTLRAVGQNRTVDSAQRHELLLHRVLQVVPGGLAVAKQGIAAAGRYHLAMQNGVGRRRLLEAPVGVPAGAEVAHLFVRLPAQLEDMGVSGHGLDEGVVAELPKALGECLQLFKRHWLIGEAQDLVLADQPLDSVTRLRIQRLREIHTPHECSKAGLSRCRLHLHRHFSRSHLRLAPQAPIPRQDTGIPHRRR